ncbi:MAG: Probable cytosol aminopeptidase, partial [uncultured Thiotrichaceae bacterium]
MQYTFQAAANAAQVSADCVIVAIYKDGRLSDAAQQIDDNSQGKLKAFLELGDFNGEKSGSQLQYDMEGVSAKRVLLVGLGDKASLTQEILAQATLNAARQLKAKKVGSVVSFLTDECADEHRPAAVRQSIQAVAQALYDFSAYKSKKDAKQPSLENWTVAHTEAGDLSDDVQKG